jgi:predicted Zn-dependent peptidase
MAVFQREVLPNGVRLLSASMPQVQSVACFIMLAAGSRYETPETSGIAHFAEHMFFKGTENRPTAQIIGNELDGIGAEFNAFTGKEYTGYYVKCAAEHRGRAFDVLVDMLRHSKFDPEEIEREKGVIVEEMNMYFDTPRDYIGGVYHQLLYGDTPLGWDIIGRKETVRAATRETFLEYVDRWYRGPKMVVGVAGNFDEGIRQQVEEMLGEVEAGDPGGADPLPDSNGSGQGVRIHSKESDQAHIAMGVPSYPLTHPDRYALQLVGTVLGTGMSSRLFTEVRERRGLAYYVFATNHSYTDTGTLYSQAGVDINRIDEAIETIARELKKIAAEPVPADELEKSKNVAKGRFVLATESPHGMITFGLRREVLEGKVEEPEDVLAGIDAVTVEDVRRVAEDVIGRNGLKLALIGPFDDTERFEKILSG